MPAQDLEVDAVEVYTVQPTVPLQRSQPGQERQGRCVSQLIVYCCKRGWLGDLIHFTELPEPSAFLLVAGGMHCLDSALVSLKRVITHSRSAPARTRHSRVSAGRAFRPETATSQLPGR